MTPLKVLAALLVLTGCTTAAIIEPRPICDFNVVAAQRGAGSIPSEVPPTLSGMTEMPLNSVSITDFAITNKIVVESTTARRNPSGSVEVWARLVNCTDFPLQIEGRTHFLDESRAPAEEGSAWHRVFLPPRSFTVYTETSTSTARVKYYFVEIREGR